MIRRISAVALLSLRSAVRSRVVVSLLVLLGCALVLFPAILRGDGTPEGDRQMLTAYPLLSAVILLGLATLWAGCAIFAVEREAGRLQLTWVQPVRPIEIWLGQWTGLVILNLVLVLIAFSVQQAGLRRRIGPLTELPGNLRSPVAEIGPDWVHPEEAVKRLIFQWRANELVPPGLSDRHLRREALQQLHAHEPLAPGQTMRIPYALPQSLDALRHSELHVQFGVGGGPSPHRHAFKGHMTLRDVDSGRESRSTLDLRIGHRTFVAIDSAPIDGARRLELFLHHDADSDAGALLLRPIDGLVIRLSQGTHAANHLRAAIMTLTLLALLAAVGLSLGAVFSFPVAAFCSIGVVSAALMSGFVIAQTDWWGPDNPDTITRTADAIVEAVAFVATPVSGNNPVRDLSDGRWIDAPDLWRAIFFRGLLYPGLLALLSSAILRRKEVGR